MPEKSQYVDRKGQTIYRFSFGPWNIHEGADPFGPEVRLTVPFEKKLELYRGLGYELMQFHDDDAVPNLDGKSALAIKRRALKVGRMLEGAGLEAEFVAPRLWETEKGIDGGYTSNSKSDRQYAKDRTRKAIDIANHLGTNNIVLWLAREGTYVREAKDAVEGYKRLAEAIDDMLRYDPNIRILIEPKPNEPMDHAYVPTMGHAVGMAYMTKDHKRVGTVMESAHSILGNLDPSDEMAFAIANDKLWSVHLNDQNGPKFDQDRAFGMVNLRRAFNQVRMLELHGYGRLGEVVGLDVKAMRPTKQKYETKHLRNSRRMFLALVDKVRTYPTRKANRLIRETDYEELDALVTNHLADVKI